MGEYPENALAVSLFGIVMAVNTLLFIALQSYIVRNLLKPEMDRSCRAVYHAQIFRRRDFVSARRRRNVC